MRETVGEFEAINKAGLLVQAAAVTDKVDDNILFLEGFTGCSLNCHQYVPRVYPSDIIETGPFAYRKSTLSNFKCGIQIKYPIEINTKAAKRRIEHNFQSCVLIWWLTEDSNLNFPLQKHTPVALCFWRGISCPLDE